MSTYDLTDTELAHFHGTEQWYRHSVVKSVLYTEGAQYVAEHGGAYWLLDEIALAQAWSWPHDSGHMWEARSPHPSCLERSLVLGSSQALACLTFSLPCS